MPRYRAVWPGEYGGQQVDEGQELVWLGWPLGEELAPINDAARRVAEYHSRYKDHSKLLSAPWCDRACELYLPEIMTAAQQAARARNGRQRFDNANNWSSSALDRLIPTPPIDQPAVTTSTTHRGGSRRRVA
jgi:hypothetical protein